MERNEDFVQFGFAETSVLAHQQINSTVVYVLDELFEDKIIKWFCDNNITKMKQL